MAIQKLHHRVCTTWIAPHVLHHIETHCLGSSLSVIWDDTKREGENVSNNLPVYPPVRAKNATGAASRSWFQAEGHSRNYTWQARRLEALPNDHPGGLCLRGQNAT
eukprot:1721955-Pyramimonas_sp.AAC.1